MISSIAGTAYRVDEIAITYNIILVLNAKVHQHSVFYNPRPVQLQLVPLMQLE